MTDGMLAICKDVCGSEHAEDAEMMADVVRRVLQHVNPAATAAQLLVELEP